MGRMYLVAAALLGVAMSIPHGLRLNHGDSNHKAQPDMRFAASATQQPSEHPDEIFLKQACGLERTLARIREVMIRAGKTVPETYQRVDKKVSVELDGTTYSLTAYLYADVNDRDSRFLALKPAFKAFLIGLPKNVKVPPIEVHIANAGTTVAYAYKKKLGGPFEVAVILGTVIQDYVRQNAISSSAVRGGDPKSGSRTVAEQIYEYFDVNGDKSKEDFAKGLLEDTKTVHEFCHVIHQLTAPAKYDANTRTSEARDKEVARRGVSHYANSKEIGFMNEFVAEVCAAKVAGLPLPAYVEDVYVKAGGPDIPEAMKYIEKNMKLSGIKGTWKHDWLDLPAEYTVADEQKADEQADEGDAVPAAAPSEIEGDEQREEGADESM